MKSRLFLNLFLAVLLFSLGVYIFSDSSSEQNFESKLTSLQKDTISDITIIKTNYFEMALRRELNTWYMLTPYKARANLEAIRLVLDIADITALSLVDTQSKDYGLEPASFVLRLDKTEIKFGNVNEVTNEQYIELNDRVFLVKTHYGYNIPYDPEKLVDRNILGVDETPEIFEYDDWRVEKGTNNKWELTSTTSSNTRLSSAEIGIWAAGWRHTTATQTTPMKRRLVSEKSFKIEMQSGLKVELLIVQDEEGYLIQRSDEDIIYRVGPDAGKRLLDPYEVAKTL